MKKIIYLILAAIPCFAVNLCAEDLSCANETKDCLMQAVPTRESCLKELLRKPICQQSNWSTLIQKRLDTAKKISELNDSPAFLGPIIIDKNCLVNFDSRWFAALAAGTKGLDNQESLEKLIQACSLEAGEIPRP